MLTHKLIVLGIVFLHVPYVLCHENRIRKNISSILDRQLWSDIFFDTIDNCTNSDRQAELKSDKLQIFCEHFHSLGDKMIADSYIQSTSGTNFRHCRASARNFFNNSCFDIPFDKDEWQTHTFLRLNTTKIGNSETEKNHRCRYRKSLGLSSGDVERWFWKQPRCDNENKSGYFGLPKQVMYYGTPREGNAYLIFLQCFEKNELPKDQINWEHIDMFCYHFREHEDYSQVAEMYFKAKGNRGTFQFCHGLSDDFTSNCFPGPWDGWKKWKFEHGEVHGERSYGFLTVNNVHCYSKDGVMGDLNGVKNWYKENEKNCEGITGAGFHNFDRNKVNW